MSLPRQEYIKVDHNINASASATQLTTRSRIDIKMPGARQPHPASSAEVERLVRKGEWFHAMIQGDERQALDVMRQDRRYEHKDSSQSKWTDPRALRENGWSSDRHNPMWQTRGVNEMLEDLDTPAHDSDKDVKIENVCYFHTEVIESPTKANNVIHRLLGVNTAR